MNDKNQNQPGETLTNPDPIPSQKSETSGKQQFVEPEISQPVNVLEATTFFQLTDSGATN